MRDLTVSGLRSVSASSAERSSGLIAYLSFVLGGLVRIDGATLRRTATTGRPTISFPAKRDRFGRLRPYVQPLNAHARRIIEEQIFALLDWESI